jgi:ERI1 exoribonuclease 2
VLNTTLRDKVKIISFFAVEFPAVLLNTLTGEIESEFQFYVQPQEQPVLSEFCKQLTGITQVSDYVNK